MEDTVEIIDPLLKKKRNVKALEIILHDIHNDYGELETRKFVKMIIVGKNREWDHFIPYEDFKEWNADVKLEE